MCSALGATALGAWSPSVPPLQVSARRAYYVQTLTGGAELSESDAAKLDKCFEAGADYVHASPAELAGRLAKNGSASSKRGRELLNTRIAAMNKRQKRRQPAVAWGQHSSRRTNRRQKMPRYEHTRRRKVVGPTQQGVLGQNPMCFALPSRR